MVVIYRDNDAAAQVFTKGGSSYPLVTRPVGALRLPADHESLSVSLERVSSSGNPADAPVSDGLPPTVTDFRRRTSADGLPASRQPRLVTSRPSDGLPPTEIPRERAPLSLRGTVDLFPSLSFTLLRCRSTTTKRESPPLFLASSGMNRLARKASGCAHEGITRSSSQLAR